MVEKFLAKKKSEASARFRTRGAQRAAAGVLRKGDAAAAIRTRRVAEYRMARRATASRLAGRCAGHGQPRVALLRSILRMALAWDELERVPVFEMTKEQGKQRYLALDEITRCWPRCAESRSRLLLAIVTVAPHTACEGELLRLIWDRVDFAVAVIRAGAADEERQGRDVPINQAYTARWRL